jgi:hypothetical protein
MSIGGQPHRRPPRGGLNEARPGGGLNEARPGGNCHYGRLFNGPIHGYPLYRKTVRRTFL